VSPGPLAGQGTCCIFATTADHCKFEACSTVLNLLHYWQHNTVAGRLPVCNNAASRACMGAAALPGKSGGRRTWSVDLKSVDGLLLLLLLTLVVQILPGTQD